MRVSSLGREGLRIHMEKALTNETQKLAQSMNMDMGIWIWVVSPLSQLFI